MAPMLHDEEYVFCTVQGSYGDYAELSPLASFQEEEGLTLVVTKEAALLAKLAFDSTFQAITLQVHSSLEAVGLTAAISKQLTLHGISANVMAGYYHDHIFVPSARAQDAMKALQQLKKS
jgi:hypothetical protein